MSTPEPFFVVRYGHQWANPVTLTVLAEESGPTPGPPSGRPREDILRPLKYRQYVEALTGFRVYTSWVLCHD